MQVYRKKMGVEGAGGIGEIKWAQKTRSAGL